MDLEMPEEVDLPFPQYHCPVCGKALPLTEARITVTCAEHRPAETGPPYEVRLATKKDRAAIEEICDRAWGETEIDAFGATFDVLSSANFIAESAGELGGLVSMSVFGGEAIIVLMSVYPGLQGHGVGSALLDAAVTYAREKRLPAMRVAVSNDDIPSLYFYQRHGFRITEVAIGLVADSLGGATPGFSGIPVRDEVRLSRPVCAE